MLDWLACTLVKSLGWLLCRLPPGLAVWLGERLGDLAYWLQPRRRHTGLRNVRAAFDGALSPQEARRIIRSSFRQLGAGLLELLRLPVIDSAYAHRYLALEGSHHLEAAVASGRPIVFLTAHYGNWELSSIAGALKGYPIVALARAQAKLPKLYRLLVSYRESKGCMIIHKGGAMRRLLAALAQGRLVGIVGDQASRQGVFVDFFGRPALFATGPFELARRRQALILPVFIHRVRGPWHRIVIEPSIDLAKTPHAKEAVQEGLERFAAALARHIREEPGQWLWMHKRWKRTPARRVLVLDDGKRGHLKQSLAIVEALEASSESVTHQVVRIRYRHAAARLACVLWSLGMPGRWGATRCLQLGLAPDSARALLSRYADIIISCGAASVPVNHLWAKENAAKSLVIMNPAPLPLKRFDLVIAPRHDRLPARRNVLVVSGAVARVPEQALRAAQGRLRAHPQFRGNGSGSPVIGVLLGGTTAHYRLSEAFVEALCAQVLGACEALDGWCLVTSSRRTPAEVERLLAERLQAHPRCRLLVLASRDPLDGTLEGILGSSDVAVVTGESISMVTEACASGRHVLAVEPPRQARVRHALKGAHAGLRHQRFLQELAAGGYLRVVAVSELHHAIRRILAQPHPAKRLDEFTQIEQAARALL